MGETAIYLRVSIDDGPDRESNSITNQRQILQRYATENGFENLVEYVDDGVSGVTFNRRGFQMLFKDIEDDKINVILVKDLSRFGRNNTLVAYYVDILFKEYNVRLIAVNDNIDTDAEHDELILPIKSILNEMYVKEISKKIRATNKQRAESGEWLGKSAPFGYRRSATLKNRLEVDPEKAEIVREVFRMADDCFPMNKIADCCGLTYMTVYNILKNPAYTGNTLSRRCSTISLKVKKKVDESEWIKVSKTHEALVDEEIFNRIQERLNQNKKASKRDNGVEALYKGLLVCAECGVALITGKAGCYTCPKCAKVIRENMLTKRVLDQIKRTADVIVSAPTTLAELRKKESGLRVQTKNAIEQNALGTLTDEELSETLCKCKQMRTEVKEEIRKATAKLDSARRASMIDPSIKLTRESVARFIGQIVIHRTHQCEITFKETAI